MEDFRANSTNNQFGAFHHVQREPTQTQRQYSAITATVITTLVVSALWGALLAEVYSYGKWEGQTQLCGGPASRN